MKVPGEIQKLSIGDREVLAIEQPFEIKREEWNEYRLLDGGTVRLKTTVQRIFRLVDEEKNQLYTDQGDPQIIVRHKADLVPSIK